MIDFSFVGVQMIVLSFGSYAIASLFVKSLLSFVFKTVGLIK